MLQAVKIVREAEQQGLATLREQASAGSAAGEFAFGNGEDSFNQGTTAIFLTRKMVSHLGADAVNAPGFLPTFGGDDAQGVKLLADKGVWVLKKSLNGTAFHLRACVACFLSPFD